MSKTLLTEMKQATIKQSEQRFLYGQVEGAIAQTLEIKPEGMGALRGRLRHLRNLQFPSAARPGSGNKIQYTGRQALQMLICVALEHSGFTPRLAIMATQVIAMQREAQTLQLRGEDDLYAVVTAIPDVPQEDVADEEMWRLGGLYWELMIKCALPKGEEELLAALKNYRTATFMNLSELGRGLTKALKEGGPSITIRIPKP